MKKNGVYVYDMRNIIRKDLMFNGVYKITCIPTGVFYVGSCSSKTFMYCRLIHHREDLIKGKHCNKYMQRSFDKYGISNFIIEVLEICSPEKCLDREQFYINSLNPKFNVNKIAGSSFGRIVSEETRLKISNSNKKWWRNEDNKNRMRESFKGRVIINKTKRKTGYKRTYTKEGLESVRKASSKKVIDMETGIIYSSLKEVCAVFNCSYGHISEVLNGKRKTIKFKNLRFYEA